MMKSIVIRLFIVACGVCALAVPARVFAAGTPKPEPGLETVVSALKQAKTSDHPGAMLDQAKKDLDKELKKPTNEQKEKDAHTACEKAQKSVGEAKTALDAKDTQTMNEKIDHAIAEVKMAIEAKQRTGK